MRKREVCTIEEVRICDVYFLAAYAYIVDFTEVRE